MRGHYSEFPVRSPSVEGGLLPLRFTTDGSGDPTLADDYGGKVTATRATNTITLTIGEYGSLKSCVVSHSLGTTATCTVTGSPTAGTIALAFGILPASATVDVIAFLSDSRIG